MRSYGVEEDLCTLLQRYWRLATGESGNLVGSSER